MAFCPSHSSIFAQLEEQFPGRPFLALGQTPFWDEPMKAGVVLCSRHLGFDREFVAGIHDTDYFAKHPGTQKAGTYQALPHNDTSTRDLWSAAGEFSSIFGSETVITREAFQRHGARIGKVQRQRPGILDAQTEAYGWRGVAYGGDNPPVVAATPLHAASKPLIDTLDWAIEATVAAVPGCYQKEAERQAERLRDIACRAACADGALSVSDFYQAVLAPLYSFVAGEEVPLTATRTTELLRFNPATAGQKRFALVDLFLNPNTRLKAEQAYNDAIAGGELYQLPRFGSFALPFDLVIPGVGRGTLRVAKRAVIVMTPVPQFITLKRPVMSVAELAAAISAKFGENCTLVGKAVSLIGMLSAEFVFVFHEGASGYVPLSRKFHQNLIAAGLEIDPSPILRAKYDTWTSLEHCQQWLRLPPVLTQPFGAEELSTKSFAMRWRSVAREQQELLEKLKTLRRPIEFIRFLAAHYSHSWTDLAERYEEVHAQMESLRAQIAEIKTQKHEALARWRDTKQQRFAAERAKGEHWRAKIFELEPTPEDLAERERLTEAVRAADKQTREALEVWRALQQQQDGLVKSEGVQQAHDLRRTLELEAELKRLKLVRQAITVTKGLERAGRRPSAWWFPLLCSDGGWFRQTVDTAEYYLEPLR